jgi:HJR/Mrr/RecB family endonuclease
MGGYVTVSEHKNKSPLDEIIEKLYYLLKDKLGFDDIQAVTLISSMILIPLGLFFGFFYTQIESFRLVFYITVAIDILVIAYSIIKFKYFKNKRIFFTKQLVSKSIEVKNIQDVNNLNPVEFEYFVREMFARQGYRAWTTQKTHDNGADVIAEKNNERVAIQVKHSNKSISGYGVYQAYRGRYNYKAEKAILVTNNEFTNQAKLDAIRDSVQLIDSHEISRFLRKIESIKLTYKD